MTRTRIIGDIHGKTYDYEIHCLKQGIRHANEEYPLRSIQVGDFGIGFANQYWHDEMNKWMKANPSHRFIRGNHDDPSRCYDMANFIPDGTVEGDVMYVGGAWSIDYGWRTAGVDWWANEELSVGEFEDVIKTYEIVKPRVMITHDCPTQIAWDMFISRGDSVAGTNQIKTRTGEAFQAMWEIHQPEHWIFGHWHNTRDITLHNTRFQCLGELDYIDIEL